MIGAALSLALALALLSACRQDVAEAQAPGPLAPLPRPRATLLTEWATSGLDEDSEDSLETLGVWEELLLSGVSGHRTSFPSWSRSGKGGP